eukprot:TRINITY_DN6309_c0_g1_i1.p1 TRINITY_DN6309_c0_g1~~TRINITY_DN6309_c0_g1_i1.p1  ORF type:complete len:508 (-),score=129.87 TRINITY_DN6309_c0_g1_i1:55-1578(-)
MGNRPAGLKLEGQSSQVASTSRDPEPESRSATMLGVNAALEEMPSIPAASSMARDEVTMPPEEGAELELEQLAIAGKKAAAASMAIVPPREAAELELDHLAAARKKAVPPQAKKRSMSEDGQPPPPPPPPPPKSSKRNLPISDAAGGRDEDRWSNAYDLTEQLLRNLQEEADRRQQKQQQRDGGHHHSAVQKPTLQVVEILKPGPPTPLEAETKEQSRRAPAKEASGPRAGEYSAYIQSAFPTEDPLKPDAGAASMVAPKAPRDRLCPSGHTMVRLITSEDGFYACETCGLAAAAGTAMCSCRECGYQVCGSCMLKADAAALQLRKPQWLAASRKKIYFRRRHRDPMGSKDKALRSAALSRTNEVSNLNQKSQHASATLRKDSAQPPTHQSLIQATMRPTELQTQQHSAHQKSRTLAASGVGSTIGRSAGLLRLSGNMAVSMGKDTMPPGREGIRVQPERPPGELVSSEARARAAAAARVLEDLEKKGAQKLSAAECSELLARWARP